MSFVRFWGWRCQFLIGSYFSVYQTEMYTVVLFLRMAMRSFLLDRPLVICTDKKLVSDTLSCAVTLALALECLDLLKKILGVSLF